MYFYAVAIGIQPGVYINWSDCRQQIWKYPGSKHCRFINRDEAWEFVKANAVAPRIGYQRCCGHPVYQSHWPSALSSACNHYHLDESGFVHVWTKGFCLDNYSGGVNAGIGVYWAPNHPRNVSEQLHGKGTSEEAEIEAATRAIQLALKIGVRNLAINTDSNNLIGATKSMDKAEIQRLKELVRLITVVFNHVPYEGEQSSINVERSEQADKLAKYGSGLSSLDIY